MAMKKLLRIAAYVLGGLLLIVAAVVLFLSMSGLPKHEVPEITYELASTPEKVERGAKIAAVVCNHCHMDPTTRRLSGRRVEDIDPAFGEVYSSNITQHPEVGIGKWTDAQLAVLIRSGLKPDGTYVPPYMPKFPLLSDDDLEAVIAYLRSDRQELQPSESEPPPCKPSLLTKILSRTAFGPLPYPKTAVQHPAPSDQVAYGRYLATGQLGCYQCHSADFKTNSDLIPEESAGFFGGGNKLFDMEGKVVYAPNITMHKTTGIGAWTEEEFVQAVKWGRNPDGGTYAYPMLPYTTISEEDVRAIYAYLKTVPAIENEVVAVVE